ncbi:MAG TPA: helix-turn-helix transcriptional regulator [Desulfitobacteriaceae bacterium]|nr:helix-turn-helix transcriptional regulator [Desulfitobacteriaceae bacterium]
MKEQPSIKQNYIFRLFASFMGLWNSRDALSFKNVRLSYLQYFFALPLSLTFGNMQEILFQSNVRLFGLDAKTLIFSAYCIGAALLFALSGIGNIAVVARVSAILSAAGFIPWIFMDDGPVGLFFALLFMFGLGGSVACASFAYTFVLNNPERFLGAVMLSFFYALVKLNAGLPVMSPLFYRIFLLLLVAGIVFCLALFKTADFADLPKKNKAKLNSAIMLSLYFFVAAYCVDYFYSYLPGSSEPKAMVLSGLFGLLAVCLSVVMQMLANRSVWHMCNLFFIAMICSYALYFAPDGSFWRDAAISLHGFQIIGYTVMFYLLGCVFKKHGDFRLFKFCLVIVLLASVLTYIIPDALFKYASALILPLAAMTSGALFVVFVLLSPAYARYLFSADWSEDFHQLDMSEAERKVELFDKLENLNLTPREKEVTALLLHGFSAKQIAGELGISLNTANFHIKNLYKKLGIGGRLELFSRFGVQTTTGKTKKEMAVWE